MPQKNPLETLQELARNKVDEATRRLGELIAGEHACEEKLHMLEQYRTEYRQRFLDAARGGIDPAAWRNYSAFLGKLDDAISMQQRIVDNSKQATAQGQQKWIDERNRAKAYDTLSQRHQAQLHRREVKAEQRISDEHGAKHHKVREE